MQQLFNILEKAKNGDKESVIYFIGKFKPTIKKFSCQLRYEEAETDLTISLIEILKRINLSKFQNKNDGSIINYIYNSLKNKKTKLFKKHVLNVIDKVHMDVDIFEDSKTLEIENKLIIENLLNTLTDHQKMILTDIYLKGHTAVEVANKLTISRQAVNSTKKKALRKLKKELNLSL